MDEYEAEQLENALDQLRKGANWASGAAESINRYASMVGRNPVPIESDEDNEGSDSGEGSGSTGDEEQPPIEPLN